MTQIARIQQMEQYLDEASAAVNAVHSALDQYFAVQVQIQRLEKYFDSGLWREDYEADETGMLPATLKRGVLSQDALFDFLSEHRELLRRMEDCVKNNSDGSSTSTKDRQI